MTDLPILTLDQLLEHGPCWLDDSDKTARLHEIAARYPNGATALDILDLPDDDVSPDDRIWVITRPGVLPDRVLHEAACLIAEYALAMVPDPDPRSVAAIAAKRAWLRGEIGDAQLAAARAAARDAAWAAARAAARAYARADAWAAAGCAAWEHIVGPFRRAINES